MQTCPLGLRLTVELVLFRALEPSSKYVFVPDTTVEAQRPEKQAHDCRQYPDPYPETLDFAVVRRLHNVSSCIDDLLSDRLIIVLARVVAFSTILRRG